LVEIVAKIGFESPKYRCLIGFSGLTKYTFEYQNIYKEATSFISNQSANFAYIDASEVKEIEDILIDKECYKDNKLSSVKTLLSSLNAKIEEALIKEMQTVSISINRLKNRLESMDDFNKLSNEQQAKFLSKFDNFIHSIESQTLIAVIRDNFRRFEDSEYQNMLMEIDSLLTPISQDISNDERVTKVEYIKARDLQLNFNKPWLENETDVDNYIEKMKEVFLKEIKNGKRIQI